jgi:hypothetical protein
VGRVRGALPAPRTGPRGSEASRRLLLAEEDDLLSLRVTMETFFRPNWSMAACRDTTHRCIKLASSSVYPAVANAKSKQSDWTMAGCVWTFKADAPKRWFAFPLSSKDFP